MQLNVQSSFGRARVSLRRLICRGLPERLSVPSLAGVSFFSMGLRAGFRRRLSDSKLSVSKLSVSKFSAINSAVSVKRLPQCGFTLIELLVVITLVGLLALGVVIAVNDVGDDAALQLAKNEMLEIKKAIRQFKLDVGDYPAALHPADFTELASKTLPDGLSAWNIDTARGWRGPYLSSDGNGLVDVGKDLLEDGTGTITSGDLEENLPGVADPFVHAPVGNYLVWRDCAACADRKNWGRPYLLFDLDEPAKARIVSMGPNGVYDGNNEDDVCVPNNDDLVLCLL